MSTLDPIVVVDAIDPDAIRSELAEIGRRAAALRVLLRAACARRPRSRPNLGSPSPKSVTPSPTINKKAS
jgi:hypothetical protein